MLPSKELGRLYSYYTAELAYLSEMSATRKCDVQLLRNRERIAKAQSLISSRGIKLQKIAAMYLNGEVQRLMKDIQSCSADLTMLQAGIWTLKDYLRALEFERDRRMQARGTGEDYG